MNSRGPVTKFLSFVDNIFGSSFANVPWDSTASFMRKVSNTEGIHVKIPTTYDGATFKRGLSRILTQPERQMYRGQ